MFFGEANICLRSDEQNTARTRSEVHYNIWPIRGASDGLGLEGLPLIGLIWVELKRTEQWAELNGNWNFLDKAWFGL
jgi:hypothetical protein